MTRRWVDVDEHLWVESDVDDGVQIVRSEGRDQIIPLVTAEKYFGPLTELVEVER